MIIDKAEVIVTSPDRNFVTLKLTTDEGHIGLGDATLNGRELAVVTYLREHVVPLLIGMDASRIEDTWQFLYRSAYWRRGPVTMAASASVDMALWDIKGKAAGMPVYQLLGGASRSGLMAYGHASGKTNGELFDSIHEHLEKGYRSIRVQTGIPGLKAIYGIASQSADTGGGDARYDHEPARRGAKPTEEDWDTRAYLTHLPGVFEAVRNEFGPDLPLLHDGHHRMTPIQAAKLGKSLEPYDLFWLEDCTPAENQEALRLVRQHTTTPLAIGEMHGPTDISPVGMAAALHLGLAIHNFGIQEYMTHGEKTNRVFEQSFTWSNGYLHPGEQPGLGVSLNVDEAGKYPYEQAYLPHNRLADGTVHDW